MSLCRGERAVFNMVEICLNPDNDTIGESMPPGLFVIMVFTHLCTHRWGNSEASGGGKVCSLMLEQLAPSPPVCNRSGERLEWAIRTAEKLLRVKCSRWLLIPSSLAKSSFLDCRKYIHSQPMDYCDWQCWTSTCSWPQSHGLTKRKHSLN